MGWSVLFFLNSVLLGVGLAMDAFSVSLANGLSEPDMKKKEMCKIAGVFASFQAMMPMIGWICVHTVVRYFQAFAEFVPWIALALLLFIGGKMLAEGVKNADDEAQSLKIGWTELLVQGIATSIDALSVGFTIAGYGLIMAIACVLIISTVTFFICMAGLMIGKRFGTKFSNKTLMLGGAILILIGLEIFITGIFY